MTQRAMKSVEPLEFCADFSAPGTAAPPPEERVSLTAGEIVALVSKIRSDTLAEAAAAQAHETQARLEATSAELAQALGALVQLMAQIEAASYAQPVEEAMRARIRAAAQHLLDGQTELFAERCALDNRAKAKAGE
jgi:hypothetical protein